MTVPILYYAPPSFYSQVAMLALVEKNLAFDKKSSFPGRQCFHLMRQNPGGTAPTLVTGDLVFDDSRKILEHVDELGGELILTPEKQNTKKR